MCCQLKGDCERESVKWKKEKAAQLLALCWKERQPPLLGQQRKVFWGWSSSSLRRGGRKEKARIRLSIAASRIEALVSPLFWWISASAFNFLFGFGWCAEAKVGRERSPISSKNKISPSEPLNLLRRNTTDLKLYLSIAIQSSCYRYACRCVLLKF